MGTTVILGLGSNRPLNGRCPPEVVLDAAIEALAAAGLRILARSRTHRTAPVGPRQRAFANAAIVAETHLSPPALLQLVKSIERSFGRRRGRVWGPRVVDIDLLAHGRDAWPDRRRWRQARGLAVPHRAMHARRFVLDPLVEVAPDWRHPVLGQTVRQLRARAMR